MRELGGNWVSSWHVIGPFSHFFNTTTAPWKSVQQVRNTFKESFGDTGADHWILDVSKPRDEKVPRAEFDGIKTSLGYIDIRADLAIADNKIRFYYRGEKGAQRPWTRLYNKSFRRF